MRKPRKRTPSRAKLAGAGFEAGALFAVADDEEVGERIARVGAETGVGLEEVVGVLARLQLGGEEDDGAAGGELQLGAELVGVRGCCALREPGVVDGVGHEELRHAGTKVVRPVVAIARADGECSGDSGAEQPEEEMLGDECREAAWSVGEPGLGAEEHGDAESVGGEDGVERVDAGVAVDPEGVECG